MDNLTAQELIYKSMVYECYKREDNFNFTDYCEEESYKDLWYKVKEKYDCCYEIEFEFREGVETNLSPKTSSRHYEIEVRAMEVDGVWVAWDFYYGGGKHGEPEAFDWISNARIVECEEKVVTKVEYRFKEITQ